MKASIVTIGNSQGIRIPKILLDQSGLSGDVELELCDAGILIRKAQKTRENWAASFRLMADNNDDELIADPPPSNYAREKWRW